MLLTCTSKFGSHFTFPLTISGLYWQPTVLYFMHPKCGAWHKDRGPKFMAVNLVGGSARVKVTMIERAFTYPNLP